MKESLKKKIIPVSLLATMVCYTTPVFAFSKEETVYSKLNSNGENYKTIVSTRIENREQLQTISDITNLLNIENTHGSETFTRDGDTLIWDAKGKDIYYQGETKEKLPIELNIKYELDGKEVTPAEIVGKSGVVKVTIEYKNNDEHIVNVNGVNTKMYTPFMVIGGTVISNSTNKVKEVKNAKVIDDGTKSIVIGIAMPGLQESLNISKDTFEIPSKIEITMETEKFEMNQIMSFATPKVIESKDSKLLDEIKTISNKIELVKSSTSQLKDGAVTLSNGTQEYTKNAETFNQKMQELSTGVSTINSKYFELNNGIVSVNQGTQDLQAGMTSLQSGIPQLKGGLSAISEGLGGISPKLETSIGALTQVDAGLEQIISGLSNTTTESNTAKIQALNAEIEKNKAQIGELTTRNTELSTKLQTATEEEKEDLNAQITLNTKVIAMLTEDIGVITNTVNSLKATDASAIDTMVTSLTTINGTIKAVNNGTIELKTGLESAKTGLDTVISKIDTLNGGVSQIAEGVTKLSSGTSSLKSGSEAMKDGLNTLDTSTVALKNANTLLTNGAKTITEGAGKLSEGMTRFDTEIGNYLNGDLKQIASRAESLLKLSDEYTNFTKANDQVKGRVKFILMTDKLRKED